VDRSQHQRDVLIQLKPVPQFQRRKIERALPQAPRRR
jgi:hypothetical protein